MKTLARLSFLALVPLVGSSIARAQEESEPQVSEWEQQLRDNHARRQQTLVKMQVERASKMTDHTRTLTVRVEEVFDQLVALSQAYEPTLEPVLVTAGYRKVATPPERQSGVLYNGRRYVVTPMDVTASGVSETRMKSLVGQEVDVVFGRRTDGVFVVVGVRTSGTRAR